LQASLKPSPTGGEGTATDAAAKILLLAEFKPSIFSNAIALPRKRERAQSTLGAGVESKHPRVK
jgi:hypothetical protein